MRKGSFASAIICLLLIVPVSAAQSEPEPLTFSIWQPGGIDVPAAEAVAQTTDLHRGSWMFIRSGTIQLLAVTRGEEIIQDARPGYRYPMASIALDPESARSRIGDEAADALGRGEIVFGSTSAEMRGAAVGDVIRFFGWDFRQHELTVGAIVDDSRVGTAELVFSYEMADAIDFDRLASVWVWDIAHQDEFIIDLWNALPPGLTRIQSSNDPFNPDSVLSVVGVKERFGEFSYRPLPGDNIIIDRDWVNENIVTESLPLLGSFRCHKDIFPLLHEAMDRIIAAGLDDHLNRADFRARGGCYNAREIRGGDKGGSLSRHSWGIAIDFNPSTNPYGGRITMDPGIVEIFHDLGFAWGGGWTFSDGGHFEWRREP